MLTWIHLQNLIFFLSRFYKITLLILMDDFEDCMFMYFPVPLGNFPLKLYILSHFSSFLVMFLLHLNRGHLRCLTQVLIKNKG